MPPNLRKKIMKQRGVEFQKHTRKPVPISETPSLFPKTNLMKLIELQHGDHLENLIYKGTIYEVGKRLGLNPSTISKWRKIIDNAFFAQFEEVA